jgi:hypothetical protein
MTTKNNVKRVIIGSIFWGALNVLPVGAHHIEHHTSASNHLWSHILFGMVFLLIAAGIYYAVSNWRAFKVYLTGKINIRRKLTNITNIKR